MNLFEPKSFNFISCPERKKRISARYNDLMQKRDELAIFKIKTGWKNAGNIYIKRQLEHLAFKDTLTNINNRRGGETNFIKLINKHSQLKESDNNRKEKDCLSVLSFDLDNFKVVNDTYGHKAGDDALIMIAQAMKLCSRKDDVLGSTLERTGGDEFFIYGITTVDGGGAFAERLRKQIEKTPIKYIDKEYKEKEFFVTVSIGVVTFNNLSLMPKDKALDCLECMKQAADTALLIAKGKEKEAKGRNANKKKNQVVCIPIKDIEARFCTLKQNNVNIENGPSREGIDVNAVKVACTL